MCKPSLVTAAMAVLMAGQASAALDNGLYADFNNQKTSVSFSVCGATGNTHGCYAYIQLQPPFDYACGVLQGEPKTKRDVMTRDIYILDKRSSNTADVILYVYQRKDVITNNTDTVSATLIGDIDLGIRGGPSANCMLVGNKSFVYASTTASTYLAIMQKSSEIVGLFVEGSPPVSLTADDRGYVIGNFSDGGNQIWDPYGNTDGDGGGWESLINQRNGWIQN